jgi:two-component system response regulator YesN
MRSRSIFFTWLLSYCVILALLLGLSLVTYFQARKALIGQIDRARTATLRQAANAIGSRLEELERLDLSISWNPRLASFMSVGSNLRPEEHYTLSLLFRDFLICKTAYPFVQSFFVYFHNSDLVLSSETVCRSGLYYDQYMRDSVPTYREWLALMSANHETPFVILGNAIAYMKSLPADRFIPVSATLVILVDGDWLTNTLGALAWNEQESMVILDAEDRVLAHVGKGVVPAGLRYQDIDDGTSLPAPYGKGLLLASARSPVLDWKVVSILPEAVFMRPVTSLQTLTLLGLVVCILAGGLMAYSFSKRNYDRISEVTRQMANLAGIDVEGGNEYAILREAVSATLSWKVKLDSDLRQNTAAMRQNFLRRLVRGRFASVAEVEQSFADFAIAPLSPYQVVFIVHPEGVPEPAARPHAAGWKLASFITANAVEAIIDRFHRGFVTEYDDMLVCIVSLRLLSALEWNNDLDAIIAATRGYLLETFGLRTSVGVSSPTLGVEAIPQAFQEALDALEYKLVTGPNTVIRYSDVGTRRSTYRCSLETEQQLFNAVRAGDEEKAREILDLIAARNLREGDVSIQSLKCFIFDMYNLLGQAVATVEESRQPELSEIVQPLMRVFSGESSLDALEREVYRVVLEVCRSMGSFRKDHRLAAEIREYVEENHADLNLSIGMIADRFDMSQGYISRLFRQMTGQGLLDFIAGVRISHAKELIASDRASLEDVAGCVGYTSANALIRAFKKHEGITPGRYRDGGG